ncbi:Sphinganine C(4)-monooxygenase 1 [Platanthera guangdongensis]|uniref:aldehyde oxygenase (deformylating) n=1 Tax=Platanthera guangdongensis TaxID=2320717 RepID=A0ABR2LK56_9ASPA
MMVLWKGHVSDEMMGTFAPIFIYWIYAGTYQLLPPSNRHCLHTLKEEEQKNLHHGLVVPCEVGALYNHPLEGLLLDTLGGAISFVIAGMTPKTAVFFFCFATIKTVDDHCGIWHPTNIFHIFENNSAYHVIHHQLQGTKYNYSQPFFSVWDRVLGTHMPYILVPRNEEGGGGGGYEARPLLKRC